MKNPGKYARCLLCGERERVPDMSICLQCIRAHERGVNQVSWSTNAQGGNSDEFMRHLSPETYKRMMEAK